MVVDNITNPEIVAVEIIYLAWLGCFKSGDTPDKAIDEIDNQLCKSGYTVRADSIFGRAINLKLIIGENSIEFPQRPVSLLYHHWAQTYATYELLMAAVMQNIEG